MKVEFSPQGCLPETVCRTVSGFARNGGLCLSSPQKCFSEVDTSWIIGDLVLLDYNKNVRLHWSLARVQKISKVMMD